MSNYFKFAGFLTSLLTLFSVNLTLASDFRSTNDSPSFKVIPISEHSTAITATKSESGPAKNSGSVLKTADYKHFVDYFNRMEDENIVQAIPNGAAWNWMQANIPLFDCPQDNFVEIYYFRWWTLRKHLRETPSGYAFTEFLINRSYADKYNLISSALGHHIMEARWLRDPKFLDQYIHVWLRGNAGKPMEKLHKFSSWLTWAVYQKYLVDADRNYLTDLLPDLKVDYLQWEKEQRLANGLYWSYDVRDGMEEQISGGRKVKNARPTINSYMFGNATALGQIADLAGEKSTAEIFKAKADTLQRLIKSKIWNPSAVFFETLKEDGTSAEVREEIGFIPWYFNLPEPQHEKAWENVKSEKGFLALFGLTTAERSHPGFRTHGCCKCEWDGPVWPYATSQTLTGMANLLNGNNSGIINDSIYFRHLELYVESQYKRGRPYVGEYLDEKTGAWLKGDEERSRYYNHSTFNDLIISGLVGLRPRADNKIEVNPLIPESKWDWFCLDNLLYHNQILTIVWDKDGTKYRNGKGLYVLVNGKEVGRSANLQRLICSFTTTKNN